MKKNTIFNTRGEKKERKRQRLNWLRNHDSKVKQWMDRVLQDFGADNKMPGIEHTEGNKEKLTKVSLSLRSWT